MLLDLIGGKLGARGVELRAKTRILFCGRVLFGFTLSGVGSRCVQLALSHLKSLAQLFNLSRYTLCLTLARHPCSVVIIGCTIVQILKL